MCMNLGCGKKPKYMEKTDANTRKTCKHRLTGVRTRHLLSIYKVTLSLLATVCANMSAHVMSCSVNVCFVFLYLSFYSSIQQTKVDICLCTHTHIQAYIQFIETYKA